MVGDFKHGYWVGQGDVGLGVWGGRGYRVWVGMELGIMGILNMNTGVVDLR